MKFIFLNYISEEQDHNHFRPKDDILKSFLHPNKNHKINHEHAEIQPYNDCKWAHIGNFLVTMVKSPTDRILLKLPEEKLRFY